VQMRKELSGVMRQISSSVAFLPLLADLCEWLLVKLAGAAAAAAAGLSGGAGQRCLMMNRQHGPVVAVSWLLAPFTHAGDDAVDVAVFRMQARLTCSPTPARTRTCPRTGGFPTAVLHLVWSACRLAHNVHSCVVACREESDGKVNTNLVEQKLRSFSTKVRVVLWCCGKRAAGYSWQPNEAFACLSAAAGTHGGHVSRFQARCSS
jgi:hypothetical protein